MANTTQPWLEDLSEEWIPQGTPPPKPRSRLPRMRPSAGALSLSEVHVAAHGLHPPKRRSALVERSLSDNNMAPSSPDDASFLAASHAHAHPRSASFSPSSLSQGSILCGTVAHHTPARRPAKDTAADGTPAWRRRLVKGELGYGDQTDLFGNTGLQNMFQKPAESPREAPPQPKGKLGLLKALGAAVPSSPPPWPAQHDSMQDQTASSVVRAPVAASQDATRTVSGQIEFENEAFSPVYLTTNLTVGPPAAPIPSFKGSELANRLRQIGTPPQNQYSSIAEESVLSHSRIDSSLARLQDESFPEGLPAGTPDMADVGRFVELRRGGYSRDGSFRRRALSPSPDKPHSPDGPVTRPARLQTALPARDNSSPATDSAAHAQTPHRHGNQFLSPERATHSGSPLKLFDAHDTFTSNRLQRRLSQLEQKSDKTVASSSEQVIKAESTRTAQKKTSTLTSVEEVSMQKMDDEPEDTQRRVSTFGQGQLNEYQFSGDFSDQSCNAFDAGNSTPDGSPSMAVAPPGSRPPFRFQLDALLPVSRNPSERRRQVSSQSGSVIRNVVERPKFSRHRSTTTTVEAEEHLQIQHDYAEGKRGPTSPFKDPIPKRRRTTDHEGEGRDVLTDTVLESRSNSRTAVHSVIGKKRKDARHESYSNLADPDTLARRHILRPRNPTPSQRRLDELHTDILEATEAFIMSSPKLNTIREQLESPGSTDARLEEARAAAIANEVATFTLKKQKASRDESRKRSVTTQDFLDEALKIMNYIRTKGRPSSGLASLEETEQEESELVENTQVRSSTSLTFDRPPSREGRTSAWKEPNKQQLDPTVMNHLRKYQEKDNDTFLNSSVHSLRFSRVRGSEIPQDTSVTVEQDDIRITDDPSRHNRDQDTEERVGLEQRTNSTHHSTGSSLGQTIATSASRRSDQVATLAPEAVAHLIPQEIAGMTFDREKNIWVRQKSPSKEHGHVEEDVSNLNDSEEDPFGNIPDLTVDATKEQDVGNAPTVCPKPTAETMLEDTEPPVLDDNERPVTREGKGTKPPVLDDDERPVTREGKGTAFTDTSSVPSKMSNFAWSYPKTETRNTSWSTQEPRKWSTQKAPQVQTTYAIPESDEGDVEHEIQYFEGRGHAPSNVLNNRHVRDITISIAKRDFADAEHTPANASTRNPAQQKATQIRPKTPIHKHPGNSKTLPHPRTNRAPIFKGDGDLSILDELPSRNYRMQLSMNVSAPGLAHGNHNALAAPSSPIKGDVTFMLSDLPEFTLNQVDECELPNRVVVKHDGARFSKALEDRYAQGTADLVKALQDVEPEEPYWEDLRKVDLHGKSLCTLNRLDELCHQLEELDVSDNSISQVGGIPYTMRRLQAQKNCLHSLTSWTTLQNLQHLDISNNEIDSLDGLAELVHLRVLVVNHNKIKSLDSIMHLDGLMELSAAGNDIELVDFSRSNLISLTDLDLRKNRLLEARNVHNLPRLEHLNLDDNEIDEFPLFDGAAGRCKSLRSLRLCRNGTITLNVDGHFPRLETLHVDGNGLAHVPGLEHLRHLRTFSARDQMLSSDADAEACVGNLVRNCEVRSLYISLNPTHGLDISQHLLNLQRLELASMGLKELPEKFGQMTPNIRSINLNFNSIKDLRPLLNIKRLDELLLVGNKLERLRANALVLGKIATLSKLDWRDNPLTLRFYAPPSENRIMSLRQKPSDEQLTDRFVLPDGDAEADCIHLERLDFETRIRRRVTEMMLANLCKNLRELDGLVFDKSRVLVKDEIWERMLLLGVIQRKQPE
ncbi:Protein nud1 [Pleosporales sp. CAS-2024a]